MPNRNIQIAGGATAALSRIGQRRQVVIPKKIFDAMKLKEGDFMEVTANRGRVSMKPKRLVDWDETFTPAEAKMIRHSLKQAREGKTRPWSRIKHELGL
ncbi:MAG TPA: AbrB/MazE/SpoVT family DNA-binding domain-containing protein [Bryobacteraceae bacterium]|jgi:AbrB family looped-hinge helix DNA binding protein|nr:AbrB/MazE/SpoVT family DNA-binding domain-containing protein [Bryobacteraceae bacterium]